MTYRETLEGLISRTKRADKRAEYEAELACPPFPRALGYLWDAFWRLRRRKGGSGFGPSPIEWPDIDAFVRYSRINLMSWEVEVIEAIDDLYLAQVAKRQSDGGNDTG